MLPPTGTSEQETEKQSPTSTTGALEQKASEIVENHIGFEDVNATSSDIEKLPGFQEEEVAASAEKVVKQPYPVEVPFATGVPVSVEKEVLVPHMVEKPVTVTKVRIRIFPIYLFICA